MARLIVEHRGHVVNGVDFGDLEAALERVAIILQDWPARAPGTIKLLIGAESFAAIVPDEARRAWLVHAYSAPLQATNAYECDSPREAYKYAAAYAKIVASDALRAEVVRVYGESHGRKPAHWKPRVLQPGQVTRRKLRDA